MLTKTQEWEYSEKKIGQNSDVIPKMHLDFEKFFLAKYDNTRLKRAEFPRCNQTFHLCADA